jgi:hypothetical protein
MGMSFEVDGFLSDTLAGRFSSMPQCFDWFELAKELNRVGKKIAFEERVLEIEGSGLSDVKTLTMLLLFRALSNFQGSILMADRGLIVEARALARCLGESVLCMVGAKCDPDHWKSLVDDELKSRRARSRLLLRKPDWLDEQKTKMLNQNEFMKSDWKPVSSLDYAKIAEKGDVEIHYVLFRQLSADAAHASLEALFRYVTEESDGMIKSLQPAPKLAPELIAETVDIDCNFFFLAMAIVLEQFADKHLENQVERCWVEYKRLGEARVTG